MLLTKPESRDTTRPPFKNRNQFAELIASPSLLSRVDGRTHDELMHAPLIETTILDWINALPLSDRWRRLERGRERVGRQ